jgi:hypothetical protein
MKHFNTFESAHKSDSGANIRVSFATKTSGYVCGRRWKYENGTISIQSTRTGKWIPQDWTVTRYHQAVSDALNGRIKEAITARRLELGVA